MMCCCCCSLTNNNMGHLRLGGGLRRLQSSRSLGRLPHDGGAPRVRLRFSPLDSSTRTRQPHNVLQQNHIVNHCTCGGMNELYLFRLRPTFHQARALHQLHLWDLRTLQRQSLEDSWPPKHCGEGRSSRMTSLTPSCFHCCPNFQHRLCSQVDSHDAWLDLQIIRRPVSTHVKNVLQSGQINQAFGMDVFQLMPFVVHSACYLCPNTSFGTASKNVVYRDEQHLVSVFYAYLY